MALKIDVPKTLIPDIEPEAIRRHISPDAIIREALPLWHANRQPPVAGRGAVTCWRSGHASGNSTTCLLKPASSVTDRRRRRHDHNCKR
jgi:hypothetical protein